MANLDIAKVRSLFPALRGKQIYFDNAGGSQVLQEVIDSVTEYLSSTNVQLGASYAVSQQATDLYTAGCTATAEYMGATPDTVVLGPSTTQLFRNLSLALYEHVTPGSEIILSKLDHEANIASWLQLAKWRDAHIVWWTGEAPATDPGATANPHLTPASLRPLLSPRTRLVACTHTSNVLGTIHDVRALARTVHEVPDALLCVDAVAYAPHAPLDVAGWGVDVYAFSWYKVYGPHLAALYASRAAQARMTTLGHFFKPTDSLENLLGLAGASYELLAAVPRVVAYLRGAPAHDPAPAAGSWPAIARHEERLQAILLDFLRARPDVFRIYGEPGADRARRVPVVSFTVAGRRSRDVVDAIEAKSAFGCRWGAFYSNRLVGEVLGLDPADGVVRASLVHYNSEEEVREFVKVLDSVI